MADQMQRKRERARGHPRPAAGHDRAIEADRKFLEREGITIVGVASTGAEALERAQELRPDVALVDVDLGAESGFELARRIAEAPEPPPVILISTRSEDDLAELIARSPALGYLSKAFLSAHAIRNLLDNGKCEHEALVYTTMEEFLAATVPFIREGLEGEEPLLVEPVHTRTTRRSVERLIRERHLFRAREEI